ncbi:MAG TPA: M20/M25/M40 family metallo-hydrolase [Gemmatimonadaceae bacterium]
MTLRLVRTTMPSRCAGFIAFLVALAGSARSACAQTDDPHPVPAAVQPALTSIRANNSWTLDQQVSICEIAAPPFKEAARGKELAHRFTALGLQHVRIDSVGNVIGERPGSGDGPTVVLAGHLDTVFPEGTNVHVTRHGTHFAAPGIGDDCRGLAVVLSVARAMNEAHVHTNGTVLFVGTVGEEGAGNLRGVRYLFERELRGKIDDFISVDGTGFGITSRAVGSHRYRITYVGPGGHSYGSFGMPNPLHALGRAIAKIAEIQVPQHPKTTFSVGVVRGGTSVNSIAHDGSMDVDLRSESAAALDSLDAAFHRAVREALTEERHRWPASTVPLDVRIDTIGIRPTGVQSDSAHIVRVAADAGQMLGVTLRTGASSTDSNIPISLGIPAITIDGGGTGHGAHSPEEWYDDGPRGYLGPQWALLIVTGLAGMR